MGLHRLGLKTEELRQLTELSLVYAKEEQQTYPIEDDIFALQELLNRSLISENPNVLNKVRAFASSASIEAVTFFSILGVNIERLPRNNQSRLNAVCLPEVETNKLAVLAMTYEEKEGRRFRIRDIYAIKDLLQLSLVSKNPVVQKRLREFGEVVSNETFGFFSVMGVDMDSIRNKHYLFQDFDGTSSFKGKRAGLFGVRSFVKLFSSK